MSLRRLGRASFVVGVGVGLVATAGCELIVHDREEATASAGTGGHGGATSAGGNGTGGTGTGGAGTGGTGTGGAGGQAAGGADAGACSPPATRCKGGEYAACVGDVPTKCGALGCDEASGCVTVAEIASGVGHVCALTSARALYCWGDNTHGELGVGDALPRSTGAVKVPNAGDVRHVTAGNHFTCALHADKTVACWGSGDHNSLGQGDTISWFSPKGVEALADVEELRAGLGNTACARKTSGELWCWGCALEGGYCSQAVGDFQAVKKVEGLGLVHTFGLGVAHACAVVTSSGITELRCWGDNGQGVLGNGSLGGASAVPVSVVGSSTSSWTSVTGSDLSSLAIADGGVAYSWGGMQPNGAAGESQTLPIARPLVANPNDGETITRFAGGWRHACAAVTTPAGDRVRCWGSNDEGALGAPVGSTAKPVDVTDGQAPLALTGVVAGWYHACAITSGGSGVKCWGNNNLGQLGDGTTSASSVPVDVSFP